MKGTLARVTQNGYALGTNSTQSIKERAMARTAELKTRVDQEVKSQATEVYSHWGISLSQAVNAFLVKSIEVGGFPFDLRCPEPNEETLVAIAEGNAFLDSDKPGRFTNGADLIAAAMS